MNCLYCDKEIIEKKIVDDKVIEGDPICYLALEVPYANLRVHRSCWKTYKDTSFIKDNTDKILNYIAELNQKPSKKNSKSKDVV